MVTSTKTLTLMPTTVYQTNRCNQHSNKEKRPCFDNVINQKISTGLQAQKWLLPQKPSNSCLMMTKVISKLMMIVIKMIKIVASTKWLNQDASFHKSLEIHVSIILPNKQNHSAFSQKRHQHDYRLIDDCCHNNLEINVSIILSNKLKHSAFTQTKIFLT